MEPTYVGMIGIATMFALLPLRIPVGLVLILVGGVGFASVVGIGPTLRNLGSLPFEHSYVYELSVIPLFVLIGNLAILSGLSRDAYAAAYSFIGHWRGGLASASIVSCALFSAVSGSSLATAVTMGRVALPEMQRYKYSGKLAAGSVAAGGTLGILIPPSSGFILYGLLTNQSIGKLFLAGFVPGFLLTLLFMTAIYVTVRLNPASGPPGPTHTMIEKAQALRRASALFLLIFSVIGGIYAGIFTPNEAAGVGAFFALLAAAWRRSLGWGVLHAALLDSVKTTAMIMLILIGAYTFNPFLAVTNIPTIMTEFIRDLDASPTTIILVIVAIYIVLGTFFESFAMMVLTLPIVFPIVTGLGYDPIWFGVIMVLVLEMGLITPPVGLNVFVVKGIAEGVSMRDIFIGVFPFWIAMLVCLLLLVAFPNLALFLPRTMRQ